MSLNIICSGFLVRYPLGGFSWHHLQYLIGFSRLGHNVIYLEDYGWTNSVYDPSENVMTNDSSYGISYLKDLLQRYGLGNSWCFLAEDGTSYGMSRSDLAQACAECDVYFNLSNINWIPELEHCRRRILVDTDPVFTQIGAHGSGGAFSRYHALFTYGENVHCKGSSMPTGGAEWKRTRQPVVLDAWTKEKGDPAAAFTTVMNWTAFGEKSYQGKIYGQKNREFEPYFSLPDCTGETMELAASVPDCDEARLIEGGWRLTDPKSVTYSPWSYQNYLKSSKAEFSVAKHGYITTQCGWFSDRSAGYLATGRPVVIQDTGFSEFLPCGVGLVPFRNKEQAIAAIKSVNDDYEKHCSVARLIAEEYFDSRRVLSALLEQSI